MTMHLKDYFDGGVGQKEIMSYLSSYNMATQAVAIDGVNAENIQDTGTAPCVINGVFIPALPADAELDISADPTGDAVGTSVTNLYTQYFAVLAAADGTLSLWKAGDEVLTAGTPVCKIPAFDPETYCCIGIIRIVNDSGGAIVMGTTALTGDITAYQVIGPVFPHPDNLDQGLGV